jgi:hypothetical protein
MMANKDLKIPNVYDFPVFKALVEVELRRIRAFGKKDERFSIGFLYAPHIADYVAGRSVKYMGFVKKIKEILREPDVLAPVEEDFLFFYFPDITREEAEKQVERIKKLFRNVEIIDGIASYPEDGETEYQLFNKLVQVMNDKLIPVIELYSEEEE